MTKHVYETHTNCKKRNCMICDGGLAYCTICHCGEGSLPTDCPGEAVSYEQGQEIYQGKIDFVDGVWVERVSVHSPAGYRQQENKTKSERDEFNTQAARIAERLRLMADDIESEMARNNSVDISARGVIDICAYGVANLQLGQLMYWAARAIREDAGLSNERKQN